MMGTTDMSLSSTRAAIMTRRLARRATLSLAALSMSALTGTTAMAAPLSVVSTNIESDFRYFAPFFDEHLDIPVVESNDTGAPIEVTNFHAAGEPPGTHPDGAVDAPGSAQAFGAADLEVGQLKARSQAKIIRDGTQFEQFNISTTTTALFGDAFETTTGGGSPYVWDGSGKGKFTIDLSGDLFKGNQTGDQSPTQTGRMGYTVRLSVTGTNGESGVCDWRRSVGGFDADMPFSDVSAVSNEGTSNVCNSSGEIILGLGGGMRLEALVDVGADFEWLLSLATRAVVSGQVDEVEANFANTLNVTYEGPVGTFTSANVFGGIVGEGGPDDPPTALPVPPALAMFGTGLVVLALVRRRDRRDS